MELHCIFISFILIDSLKIKCLLILHTKEGIKRRKKSFLHLTTFQFRLVRMIDILDLLLGLYLCIFSGVDVPSVWSFTAFGYGNHDFANFSINKKIELNEGINTLDILSMMVGLQVTKFFSFFFPLPLN